MIEHNKSTRLPEYQPPATRQLAEDIDKIADRSRNVLREFIRRQASGDNFQIPDPAIVGKVFLELSQKMLVDPGKLVQAQASLWQDYLQLMRAVSSRVMGGDVTPVIMPEGGDKRFKDDEWSDNIVFDAIKQSYLLTARTIQNCVENVAGLDPKMAERSAFYTRQLVDAMAPTNFPLTNPKVLRATIESGGGNLVKGLGNLLDDLDRGEGQLRVKMTDLEAFELGENVAATPGKVVFQNDLMQLLQYQPSTEAVFEQPLLFVPPWINKYYILDLRPKNSFIKWAVDKGFTVFVISWVNPDERLAEKSFEDYLLDGPIAALAAIERATGAAQVNALSYCLGGTLLMCALAYLSARGDERIKSATCFTTMLDFAEPGELSVFIDDEQLDLVERHMEKKGYLDGTQMANVFNLLRANDLIWSFAVNNYLMGKGPFPFDLLYWNSDSTRMPKVMHNFYLRCMYQRNALREPGGITLDGTAIDLGRIKAPVYFLSTREDHIAPWQSTYAGARLPGGKVKFVLAGSGHIAGVINPEGSRKYGYSTNGELPPSPQAWLATCVEHEGSWWPDWYRWVRPKAGVKVKSRVPGDRDLTPIEDAPGAYVKIRI
jgi:polyhydroxyalkanoate synthase